MSLHTNCHSNSCVSNQHILVYTHISHPLPRLGGLGDCGLGDCGLGDWIVGSVSPLKLFLRNKPGFDNQLNDVNFGEDLLEIKLGPSKCSLDTLTTESLDSW